jgi:hypothetical protein
MSKLFSKHYCQHCFETNKSLIQQICASHVLVVGCGGGKL